MNRIPLLSVVSHALLAAVLTAAPRPQNPLAALPLFFEPAERGSGVEYVARGSGLTAGITARGALLRLDGSTTVEMTLAGSGCAAIEGTDRAPGVSNYLRGRDPKSWRTQVPHFSRVSCRSAYPGIDVVYYGRGRRLEYDFAVAVGADPSRIRIRYRGAGPVRIGPEGDLIVATPPGELVQKRPLAWQNTPEGRRDVAARYVRAGGREFRLALGAYDRSLPLVVDPVLEYLTYLGGGKDDTIGAIALDADGNAYIAGSSTSADFPVTAGSFQSKISGKGDIFIAKLTPSGTALAYATFVGGTGGGDYWPETATAIAVDMQGNAYVAGYTDSPDFPVTAGAWQTTGWNGGVAFKLDASGSRLLYSTFLAPPGSGVSPTAIVLKNGAAYIAGSTSSVGFYGTAGAFQRDFGGGRSDGVILALDPDGTQQLFATLLGGSGDEYITALKLDDAGNIYVAGSTSSVSFPVAGGLRTSYQGASDAFVAKLDPAGSKLLFSVLAGGAKNDSALGLALDPSGNVVVSGSSQDFSGLAALRQPANLDPVGNTPSCCGFLLKLTPDGASVLSLGISHAAFGPLQMDLSGYLYTTVGDAMGYVSGGAASADGLPGALVKISPTLDRVLFCAEFAQLGMRPITPVLAVGPYGDAYVAGETDSRTLPTTPGVFQPTAPPLTDRPSWNQFLPRDGFAFRANLSQFQNTNFFIPASNLSFKYRMGDPEPAPVSIPVSFSGPALGVMASTDVPGIEPSVTAQPPALQVRVNPAKVSPGKFAGNVTLSAPALTGAAIPIPIALEVLAQPTYTLNTDKVDFQSQEGLGDQRQTVSIGTDFHGQLTCYAFQVVSDQPWLRGYVSPGSGDACDLTVYASATKAGSYSGTLTISLQGVPNSTRTIKVTYTVLAAPTMTLSTQYVVIRATVGQPPPPPQTVTATSSTPNFPFTVFTGTSYNFFSITATSDKTPGSIVISADHTGLSPGIWTVVTSVNLAGQPAQNISITLVVSTTAPLDVTPSEVAYSFMRGASSNPYAPVLALTGSEQLVVSLSTDQPWLMAAFGGNTTPTKVYLTFNPNGLAEGVYKANLTINVNGRDDLKKVVPVTYNLTDVPQAVVTPAQIAFKYRMGDPAPPEQIIKITSPNLTAACFNMGYFLSAWLNIREPLWGCTPYQLTLSLNLDKVTPGHYTDQIRVDPVYRSGGGGKLDITLDVSASDAPPPVLAAVVNAASYEGGEIAPGEIVTLFGTDLGPKDLTYSSTAGGRFATSASGTRVLFDGVAAPVVYASAGQVSAIVPYGLSGQTRTEMVAEYNGVRSGPALLAVAEAAPALFAADASGKGQGAIQNYHEGAQPVEYNSASAPAARGSIVILYATGEGQLAPAQADGVVTGAELAKPLLPVRVWIGGQEAEVLYAGTSPGSVAGLLQINARVPAGAPVGQSVPVMIHAGDRASQPGVALAIK
jgi:uncharacterized protein (TIGR03437 family)